LKIIHCADLHLASALETSLSAEKARERRNELMIQFSQMIRYAKQEGVRAILIAGDLFDSAAVPTRVAKRVFDMMTAAEDILFFYLRGNHDCVGIVPEGENILVVPQDGTWVYYDMDQVTVALCDVPEGMENTAESLVLSPERVNIAVLHGDARPSGKSVGTDFAMPDFAGKNIDYLALGHYHSYRVGTLDDRGVYCYSGCLEGRGFDECGQKGFVMLDVEGNSLSHTFIPFSKRTLHSADVDVTGCTNMQQLEQVLFSALSEISEEDMVRVTLIGSLPADMDRDMDYLASLLQSKFYASRLHDHTGIVIDPQEYADDLSLKGLFVNHVLQSELEEDEKQRVLSLGLHLMLGGEVNV